MNSIGKEDIVEEQGSITEAEVEYLARLRKELEEVRKASLRHKLLGAFLIAMGMFFLFLALFIIARPLAYRRWGIPWSEEIAYMFFTGTGSLCFAAGLYVIVVS